MLKLESVARMLYSNSVSQRLAKGYSPKLLLGE